MPKEVWGTKHLCESCGTKFYDLLRSPVECPKCGDHLEVFFKETHNTISDESDQGDIDINLDSSEESIKSDTDDGIEDDVDDILDDDEDTVSLDEIKNITTEDPD